MERKKIGTIILMLVVLNASTVLGISFEGDYKQNVILSNFTLKKETFMVPMRDGILLSTDVYLPEEDFLPQGTILVRTPYDKNEWSMEAWQWTNKGWVTVVQDFRGRYESEGIFDLHKDNTDGVDTAEWIVSQGWSNGKVATWGRSARANCQYAMAGETPMELTCQFLYQGTPDSYKYLFYQGGEFRKNFIEGMCNYMNIPFQDSIEDYLEHENFSLDFWGDLTLQDNWNKVNIPAIHIGGWYDVFLQGTIDGFLGYQYNGGVGAKGNSKLVIGPWVHARSDKIKQGQLTYPDNSKDNFTDEMFEDMINTFTMDGTGDGDFDKWPNVYYYIMGDVDDPEAPGNKWVSADDWPISATNTKYYLHENGVLDTNNPVGDNSLSFLYDPNNPVPTVGGQNIYGFGCDAGPYDQTSTENRDDVLVFTSSVLDKPVGITGHIYANLFVSSDCIDTDFTVKLTDVYPDGRSMLITDGILRLRNRNGMDHWEFLSPNEIYEIMIDLGSTAYIWNNGHQIRVVISSSNSPRFLINTNTRQNILSTYFNPTYKTANNNVYISSKYPSSIIFPIIEVKGKLFSIYDNILPKFNRLIIEKFIEYSLCLHSVSYFCNKHYNT
jgi:predicted acyl esterase